MTYSSEFPNTFLSLDRYANLIGLDPIQFQQGVTTLRNNQNCSDIWYQFSWQDGGKISREELRQAISQAESDLIAQIKYFPSPQWHAETIDYPQFYQKEYRGVSGYQASGFTMKSVKGAYGYPISGGIRATSQISASSITRNADIDTTGDGFDDTASFTVTIDFTDICELKAYFKIYNVADVANTRTDPGSVGADDYWQIKPTNATLSGTTATVYVPIYLLFKPQLQRQINADTIDADVATSYVDTIEFYRVYNDPSTQAIFLWSNESACNSTGCAWASQTGCIRKTDTRTSSFTVQPATWDSTTETFTQSSFSQNIEPDRVILYYYSGYRDQNTRNCDELSYYWAYTIAMLATARLNKPVCTCDNVVRQIERWQEDIALVNGTRSYNVNLADLSNPFGTRLGEISAFNRIKSRGIKLGNRIKTY